MNKIYILILTIFLINFIAAVPPVTTTQQFTEGYTIQVPQDNILKVGQDYVFEFHVFNISNGFPKTSGISCDLHLYNSLGNNLFTGVNSVADVYGDYTFNVSKGNFSNAENDYYFIRCNSSTLGGFSESILYITPSGELPSTSQAFFYIGILILLIVFVIVAIYIFVNAEQIWSRTASLGLIYLLFIAVSFVSWTMASNFLTTSSFLIEFLRILFLASMIGFFPFLLGLFAYGIYMMLQLEEIRKLQEQGFDLEEATEKVKNRRKDKKRW